VHLVRTRGLSVDQAIEKTKILGLDSDHMQEAVRDFLAEKHIANGQEFVLKGFRGGEASKARTMMKKGSKSIITALEKGMESAQNQFNTK
jgi:hypothetical protein